MGMPSALSYVEPNIPIDCLLDLKLTVYICELSFTTEPYEKLLPEEVIRLT